MSLRPGMALAALSLAGCGSVVVESMPGGSSGSSSSSSGSSGGVPVTCEPQPQGSGGAALQPTCADLAVMTVSDPVLTDEGGDGMLGFGEKATLTVKLNEVAGKGFNWYPGVTFTSDTVSVPDMGGAQFYAILPCTSVDASVPVSLLSPVPAGTVVQVKAQVWALGLDCPDAPSIMVPIVVN